MPRSGPGNEPAAAAVLGAMFDKEMISKMNPHGPSPGEPMNVPLGDAEPRPGEAFRVVTIIGWTAVSSGLVGAVSRPGDPTYWVSDFGIMWKRGASQFSLPPSLGSMDRAEIERRAWDMAPEVRAVLDRHFDGVERVTAKVVEDAIQRGLRSLNHGAASVPQHWFEQQPPSDFERNEVRTPNESAAERRAKAKAAELTPEALTALGQFDVPRLPGAPAVVKELFIDGKRMDLGERQVVEPEIGAGFTVIVRADDVRWTIGGREIRQPDHRSDRENRTDSALAEFNRHLDPRVLLVDDLGLWAKAVEWYENRPIGGDTDGEALYGCAAMFLPGAKACRWANVLDHERLAFERAATRLVRHRL